jgi:predicted metal-dependent enzyme (double-stranded beta helix superfamily)
MTNMSAWRIPAAEAAGILQWVQRDESLKKMDSLPQPELQAVCRQWSTEVKAIDQTESRMAFFEGKLPELLSRRTVFEGILRGILSGNPYPDLRQETLFENELILFRDPGQMFSLRLYVFGPGEYTPVHDHTSWGVSGSAFGKLEVVRYRREGLGPASEGGRLAVAGANVLVPGEIESTLPLDKGIHRTGNPVDGITLMVSVYGRPLRRLYIQYFNIETGRVDRRYPSHLRKRMLAEQALEAIEKEGRT